MTMNNEQGGFGSRIDYGNLESNLRFLNETSILDKQKKILEIGSGTGSLLSSFYREGYNIRGVEINKARLEKSRSIYGELPLSLIVNETLPFENNSFDIIMSFDVFEHIPDSDTHLSEVYRILKENGHYLLQTPNKFTNAIFETIRWRSFTKWRKDHCSLHSYWEIIDRFNKNGFDVEFYSIPVVNEFFKRKVKKYLGNFGLFVLRIVNPDKLPTIIKPNFYIVARRH